MINSDIRFDAVLPSHLIFNKSITPHAKLFYPVIRNLCNTCGYCWANNNYLSELMGVSDRNIRRWLSELQEQGYIDVDLGKPSENTDRKIYISERFKKIIPRTKMSAPPDKNVRHKEDNKKEDKECYVIPPENGGNSKKIKERIPIPKKSDEGVKFNPDDGNRSGSMIEKRHPNGSIVKTSESEIYAYAIREKKDWSAQEIGYAICALKETVFRVADPLRFIEGTIRQVRNKKKSDYLKKENEKCKAHKKKFKKEYNNDFLEKSPNFADPATVKQIWRI